MAITRYRKYIMRAMYVGIVKSFKVGFGAGLLYLSIFLTNALGFWYGAKIIADQLDSHCTSNCLTGGKVMTVFFCTIMGSMALGQVAPAIGKLLLLLLFGSFSGLTRKFFYAYESEPNLT